MKPDFKTEADLCTAFIRWVKAESGKVRYGIRAPVWTPYAETAGWDILLVGEDGTQIGVEAKLRFNLKVLGQSLPDQWDYFGDYAGPDYRAVLVPQYDGDQQRLCGALGLVIFSPISHGLEFRPALQPDVGARDAMWHHWNPAKRCKLPDYIPDVQAGSPAPLRLTEWKIKALRILATIEARGYVTKQDFKECRIDSRVWVSPAGYLVPGQQPGHWVRGKAEFDKQHPDVYPQILAEVREHLAAKEAA